MQQFSSLDLSAPVLDAIREEGYETPTPIQAQAIPPVLAGRDLLGCAQTGTGKTAAFALPIIDRLHAGAKSAGRGRRRTPRALIVSPTRELATQIGESFQVYGRHTRLRHCVIFGGVNQYHQVRKLQKGVDILVATPGRLLDLMDQGHVDLMDIEVFVLDEADRMLDMGFIHPIRKIAASVPDERQTLLFSATMPRSIMHLADSLLRDPVKVAVTPAASTVDLIEQAVYMVPRECKLALLEHLLDEHDVERAIVFTRTKHGADKLTRKLNKAGVTAGAIHGNKAQNQRQRALASFREGRSRVLVATDVAARGIDVQSITHVFNFDMPNEPESYVHRIGRTGRAGESGVAISFCDRQEREHLRAIERLTGERIEQLTSPNSVREAARQARLDEPRSRPEPRGERRRGAAAGGSRSSGGRSRRGKGGGGPRSAKPSSRRPGGKARREAGAGSGRRGGSPRAVDAPREAASRGPARAGRGTRTRRPGAGRSAGGRGR